MRFTVKHNPTVKRISLWVFVIAEQDSNSIPADQYLQFSEISRQGSNCGAGFGMIFHNEQVLCYAAHNPSGCAGFLLVNNILFDLFQVSCSLRRDDKLTSNLCHDS